MARSPSMNGPGAAWRLGAPPSGVTSSAGEKGLAIWSAAPAYGGRAMVWLWP